MSELINYNPDLIQRKIGVWESSESKCTYTEYFTGDNESDGIENATHNTFAMLTWIFVFLFKKHKT
jgi:hypothetical protein